jgi:hypothetical protein
MTWLWNLFRTIKGLKIVSKERKPERNFQNESTGIIPGSPIQPPARIDSAIEQKTAPISISSGLNS